MRARIIAANMDGTKQEAEGVFAGWADQIAFERRFGLNAAVLSTLDEAFNADGTLRSAEAAGSIRSEWIAYLAWRIIRRAGGEVGPEAAGTFDAWVEELDDLELHVDASEEDDESAVDPTATATAPPIS